MAQTDRYTGNKSPYSEPMSIFDAYRAGRFGDPNSSDPEVAARAKSNRDYFLVDALANYGRNTAQDFGKYAAAYSGGNFTPQYTDSAWDARNKALLTPGAEAEAAGIKGSTANIGAESASQNVGQKEFQLKAPEQFAKQAAMIREKIKNNPNDPNANVWNAEATLLDLLSSSTAGTDVGTEEFLAAAAASDPNIMNALTTIASAASNGIGTISDIGDKVKDMVNNWGNSTEPQVASLADYEGNKPFTVTYPDGTNETIKPGFFDGNTKMATQKRISQFEKEIDKLNSKKDKDVGKYMSKYGKTGTKEQATRDFMASKEGQEYLKSYNELMGKLKAIKEQSGL